MFRPARLLLERGARIDARDEDHESTPAQWLIRDAPDVVRFLLDQGAAPDIFLAVALGDRDLVSRLIDSNPGWVAYRIGRRRSFLARQGRGGTIYRWTLAFNSYAHQIALLNRPHRGVRSLVGEERRHDASTRLCVLARRADAEAIVARHPGIIASLPPRISS